MREKLHTEVDMKQVYTESSRRRSNQDALSRASGWKSRSSRTVGCYHSVMLLLFSDMLSFSDAAIIQ